VSAPSNKSRSEKVITAIEGDDEFSVASVDPEIQAKQRALKLSTEGPVKLQATQDERTIWRLFRKIFT
jgi:hypothetical protein